MVKNKKKFGAQTFGLIALSLMLVASMVLGLTGAWFTSSGNGSDTAKFGKVEILVPETVTTIKSDKFLLPGDSVDNFTITNNSDVDIYVRAKIVVSTPDSGAVIGTGKDEYTITDDDRLSNEQIATLQTLFNTANAITDENGWIYYHTASAEPTVTAGWGAVTAIKPLAPEANCILTGIKIPETTDDSFQNKYVTFTITVEAVQAANQGETIVWANA